MLVTVQWRWIQENRNYHIWLRSLIFLNLIGKTINDTNATIENDIMVWNMIFCFSQVFNSSVVWLSFSRWNQLFSIYSKKSLKISLKIQKMLENSSWLMDCLMPCSALLAISWHPGFTVLGSWSAQRITFLQQEN